MSSAKETNLTNFTVNLASPAQSQDRKLIMSKTGTFGLVEDKSTKVIYPISEELTIESIKQTIQVINPCNDPEKLWMLSAINSLLTKLENATKVPNFAGSNLQLEWDSSSDEEVNIKDENACNVQESRQIKNIPKIH